MSHTLSMREELPKIVFFGTPDIAVWVLSELERCGIVPSLIVTKPDTPQGRKMIMTASPVSVWAQERGIEVYKPPTLKSDEVIEKLRDCGGDLFIVAAYGKIIPQHILDIPKYGTLNVHPSLLPLLRGASPIRSAILNDMHHTGVSIMLLTAGMDEGPILAQRAVDISPHEWPISGRVLDERLSRVGGVLLAETIPLWVRGDIAPTEQEHSRATYTKKITKDMAEISLADDSYQNLLKIKAYDGWPTAYFFYEKNGKRVRINIIDAHIEDNALTLTRVVPEGKKEMSWETFLRGEGV